MFGWSSDGDFSLGLSHRICLIDQHGESFFHQLLNFAVRILMPQPILKGTVHGNHLIIPRKNEHGSTLGDRLKYFRLRLRHWAVTFPGKCGRNLFDIESPFAFGLSQQALAIFLS